MPKIFRKNITPQCAYCSRGMVCNGTKKVVCAKKGVTESTDSCRKFKYDPLKREPLLKLNIRNFENNDFVL